MNPSSPEGETLVPEKNDVRAESSFEHWLRRQFPNHSLRSLREALKLHAEGAPVPYLAFYQKDAMESLKCKDLYKLVDAKSEWEEISRKQTHVLQEVQAQGKLTDELRQTIERSFDLDRLEDLYAPFKLKRQSLGAMAREAGLGVLADYLWEKSHGGTPAEISGESLEQKAESFVKADSKYTAVEMVLKGVQDILVERIAENSELRSLVRGAVFRRSKIKAAKGPKAKLNSKYTKYFDYQEPIGSLKKENASYRYLVMRKAWMEDELTLSFDRPEEGVLIEKFEETACLNKESIGAELLLQAARLALKGNVYTVMENEAHRSLKEEAEKHVIVMLAENLQKKLLRPAFGQKAVMGIDPGTANHPCSLALIDATGKYLLHLSFRLEEAGDSMKEEFLKSLETLQISAIAVAHGPRAKELRDKFREILTQAGKELPTVEVHEHSANIYASSPSAKEEFPELDVNTRRALFVARYLQDPLTAILRLEPKFLSLGELQHEVPQGKLNRALQETIEFCVNFVGVDVNYSTGSVLSRVAGLNLDLAKAIIHARNEKGLFKIREELKKVSGFTDKTFLYSAGFLKIRGQAPLENTFVHPNFYGKLEAFAQKEGCSLTAMSPENLTKIEEFLAPEIGPLVAKNMVYELAHLGEDPRGEYETFHYSESLKTIADIQKGARYPGIVTNVTSFGVFVDIGIEQDGLVHISDLAGIMAKNPHDSLFPGDQVDVFVTNVNVEKKQISFSMSNPAVKEEWRKAKAERGAARHPRREEPRRRRPEQNTGAAVQPAATPQEAQQQQAPNGVDARDTRQPRDNREPRRDFRPRRDSKEKDIKAPPRKEKKPQRDPKTGAVVKLGEEYSKRDGPRVPSRAQPTTFNPFANLADLLKTKEK